MLNIKWLGQAGYELWDGETGIIIDPYLSDSVERAEGMRRMVPAPYTAGDFACDGLLCTHDHADHLDRDFLKGARLDKIGFFAGPDSCVAGFRQCGVSPAKIRRLNAGERTQAGAFGIHAVRAEHTADSIGLVLTHNGLKLYFTGDSLYTESVGAGIACDIIFVCINGKLGNMDYREAARLTRRIGAGIGVPAHYGMFSKNNEDPQKYLDELNRLNIPGYVFAHNTWTNIEKTDWGARLYACGSQTQR